MKLEKSLSAWALTTVAKVIQFRTAAGVGTGWFSADSDLVGHEAFSSPKVRLADLDNDGHLETLKEMRI